MGDNSTCDVVRTIGGSDVAAILGVAPPGWRTARDVWLRIVTGSAPDADAPHLEFGRRLEPAVLDWYLDRLGLPRRAARRGIVLFGGDVGAPECHGRPDAVVRHRRQGWIVEIKTSAVGWSGVPPHYLTQALHYLALLPSAVRVDFAVLDIRARTLIVETIDRAAHADLIDRQLRHVRAWWARHVAPALRPGLSAAERERYAPVDAPAQLPVVVPEGAAVADADDLAALARYRAAQRAAAAAEAEVTAARDALIARLRARGASTLVDAAGQRLAWARAVQSTRLDQRRLIAERPEIVAQYQATSQSVRLYVAGEDADGGDQ